MAESPFPQMAASPTQQTADSLSPKMADSPSQQTPVPASAQDQFFRVVDLVVEVVSYLDRAHIVACRQVSKTFFAACAPRFYRSIPMLRLLSVDVDMVTRHHKIVTVALEAFDVIRAPEFRPAPDSFAWTFRCDVRGEFSMAVTGTEQVFYLCSAAWYYALDRFPPSPSVTRRTIVLVPPAILGTDPADGLNRKRLALTLVHQPPGNMTIVGLEDVDPFTDSEERWAERATRDEIHQAGLLHSLINGVQGRRSPILPRHPEPYDVSLQRMRATMSFTTLKDYLETGAWRDVLDALRVGAWLNKYDEREARERAGQQAGGSAGGAEVVG